MNQPNAESLQALRELGESQFGELCKDKVVMAIASCGVVDLDKSIAAYREAQRKVKETRTEIKSLKARIATLNTEAGMLESRAELLLAQERELAGVTILDTVAILKVLFSLVREIEQAICMGRGYVEGRCGFVFYQLPFLERFILPALAGNLPSEWAADDMWAAGLDRQITQRIAPYWLESSWKHSFIELKKNLSPEQWHILVAGICESERCTIDQLKELITQLREKLKGWPIKWQNSFGTSLGGVLR